MTRILQIGGNHFTEVVMNAMQLEADEAEALKIAEAEVVSGEEEYISELSPKRRALLEGIYDVAHGLCLECKRSITYHDAQLQSKVENLAVKDIVLAGGSSKLKGFGELLSNITGLPVGLGNPYKLIKISSATVDGLDVEKMAPVMSVAVGLALREVVER